MMRCMPKRAPSRALNWVAAKKASAYVRVFSTSIRKPFNELLHGSSIGEQRDVSALADAAYKELLIEGPVLKKDTHALPYVIENITNLLAYLEIIAEKNRNDVRLYLSMVSLSNIEAFMADTPHDQATTEQLLGFLDTAHALSPTNPEIFWSKAQVYMYTTPFVAADVIEAYEAGIAIDPSIERSHELLTEFTKKIEGTHI